MLGYDTFASKLSAMVASGFIFGLGCFGLVHCRSAMRARPSRRSLLTSCRSGGAFGGASYGFWGSAARHVVVHRDD